MDGFTILFCFLGALVGIAAVAAGYAVQSIPYKKGLLDTKQVLAANPQILHAYRAMYGSNLHLQQLYMDELYVGKDRIWMEKSGQQIFSAEIKSIKNIAYNSTTIVFSLFDGSQHEIFSLHPDLASEGLFRYKTRFGATNVSDALASFVEDVRNLNIPINETANVGRPNDYYLNVTIAIIGACLIVIAIIYNLFFK